jgi:hypothetical protein
MQSFTITQWLIVALVFVAGWLLGLASHPGGRKWRERYAAERDAHAAYRRDADARVAAAETRHRDLERDHARLATQPVAAQPVAAAPMATATTTTRPVATRVIRPGDTGYVKRGWFDFGPRRT